MKDKAIKSLLVMIVIASVILTFVGEASAKYPMTSVVVPPVPWEGPTALPEYKGGAAKAHPIPPAQAPQNPFLAPNPFSNYHNDTWMSDTYDIAGPLGRNPVAWSSNLEAARVSPETGPLFHCGTLAFDRYGRIVTICSNPNQTTVVLVDPDTLEVLTHIDVPSAGNTTAGLGAGYMLRDNLDRAWSPIGDKIVVIAQTGDRDSPAFSFNEAEDVYDLSAVVPEGDVINSLVPDFKGRIWFVVRHTGIIGILDPATGAVQQLHLGEEISNSFSIAGADAYVVTTKQLYRLRAGDDNVPYVVWSAGYENPGIQKPGQLSAGSGTTPTILGNGEFVAIADNAYQTHVVVYRTAEQLPPNQDRMVCQVDVFEPGLGAVEDSLIGSGRSLIASNNYGYTYNPDLIDYSTEPGIARVDINPNGKGCHKVWTNTEVNPGSYGAKLSTRTGLAYVVSRKLDPSNTPPGYPEGVNAWYFTAIDFRTGATVWEQLAGTGRWFDGYWPLPFIGPNGALYAAGNGGIFAVRDTNGAEVEPIPPGPPTSLPDYAGAPTRPDPIGNSRVPQNRLLAPNGFNSCHLDPWMSDTTDVAGPVGFRPVIVTSTFAAARPDPIDTADAPAWLFLCITPMFDSHGRLLTTCFAPHEATVVLADPDKLEVLSTYPLELPSGDVYRATGRQAVMRSTGSSYAFLDSRNQLTSVSGGKKIVTLVEDGSAESPVLALSRTYDLTDVIPANNNDLSGVMLDWQGRIWFITIGTPDSPAVIGVLDPAKYTDANSNAKVYELPRGEYIRNTFAVTKSGKDRASAYIVTSQSMYRIDAGPDGQPQLTWSAPYDTIGTTKDGQYELGSGTSPTVLGEGKYVAITDNAIPMKVVVFRTDERLQPDEDRVVCQVKVFEETPGALSNSLIGFRNSLIASNNYNYLWDWPSATTVYPSEPGFARIDINPDGKGCQTAWTNSEVATTVSPRLSTKSGLIYTVAREYDVQNDVFVYYWIALDFHTGEVAWKKMAGSGDRYDSFYPALAIGPNQALYVGVFGGFMTVRDTR